MIGIEKFERIVRAVASSSAIETGERTAVIEKRLKSRSMVAGGLDSPLLLIGY